MKLKYKLIRQVPHPVRSTSGSAGIDFSAPVDLEEFASIQGKKSQVHGFSPVDDHFDAIYVPSGASVKIPSGVKVEVPEGYALVAFNRSSMAVQGFQVGACVIDSDYQGEIFIHLRNVSNENLFIRPGQKIVQFVLMQVPYVELIETSNIHEHETERGENGFGSTD